MPPALLRRHGIEPDEITGVSEAFAAGDVRRALEVTPVGIADRLVLAGSPAQWVDWLNGPTPRGE